MDRPYDSIPRAGGEHRPDDASYDTSSTVRAPKPPHLKDADDTSDVPDATTQLLHNEGEGLYRLRAWTTPEPGEPGEGYTELHRYSGTTWAGVDEHLPKQPRFVVFENTDTGEVYFGRNTNLSDNWTDGGRFDQVTIFATEEDAAAYAESRGTT